MTFTEHLAFCGWGVTAMAFFYSIYRNHILDKRTGKIERQLAEELLRGKAPYLTPSKVRFTQIYEESAEGLGTWYVGNGNVLSFMRAQVSVDTPAGTAVILPLDNKGEAARRLRLDSDLKGLQICQEADFDGAHGLNFLKYNYEPDKRGKLVNITMKFETSEGRLAEHVYQTTHGEFDFRRIKPE